MLDCIYLHNNNNQQTGHEVLNLLTREVITKAKVTIVPVTQNIINLVERMDKKME